MSYHFKRIKPEEEESILGLKRKQRIEREPKFLQGASRFPLLANGSQSIGFATLRHGSLSTWDQLQGADKHNTREIEGPNIRKDAPEPVELLPGATGTYRERARALLDERGVSRRVRQGGTLAIEDIYSASPEYWDRDGKWREKPVAEIMADPLIERIVAFAQQRYGKNLISISLHLDEATPHVHVVALPLVKAEHAVRGPKPKDSPIGPDGKRVDTRPRREKWSLNWSALRWPPSRLERAHDDYAASVADLGLARGTKGSALSADEKRTRKHLDTGKASKGGQLIREERERILAEAERQANELVEDAMDQLREALIALDMARDETWVRERALDARACELDERASKLNDEETDLKARSDNLAGLHQLGLDRLAAAITREFAVERVEAAQQAKSDEQKQRQVEIDRDRARVDEDRLTVSADQAKVKADRAEVDGLRLTLQADEKGISDKRAENERVAGDLSHRTDHLSERERALEKIVAPYREATEFLISASKAGGHRMLDRIDGQAYPVVQNSVPAWWGNLHAKHRDAFASCFDAILIVAESAKEILAVRDKARRFEASWKAIPATERSPSVNATLGEAQGLPIDDLPPGFDLPGKGGIGR